MADVSEMFDSLEVLISVRGCVDELAIFFTDVFIFHGYYFVHLTI